MFPKAEFIKRLACLPSHIYRLKGFMTFEDTAHTYLIQFTQGQYELTPVAFSKKVPEYLVLIGKGISKKTINVWNSSFLSGREWLTCLHV